MAIFFARDFSKGARVDPAQGSIRESVLSGRGESPCPDESPHMWGRVALRRNCHVPHGVKSRCTTGIGVYDGVDSARQSTLQKRHFAGSSRTCQVYYVIDITVVYSRSHFSSRLAGFLACRNWRRRFGAHDLRAARANISRGAFRGLLFYCSCASESRAKLGKCACFRSVSVLSLRENRVAFSVPSNRSADAATNASVSWPSADSCAVAIRPRDRGRPHA